MRFFFTLLLLTSLASAHLSGGEDKVVDGYLVDFGFEPASLSIGQRSFLSFNLVNPSTLETVNYSSAWIRISQGDEVLFASNLAPIFGNVALTYIFPKGGKYVIDVEFKNHEVLLVKRAFEVRVAGQPDYAVYAPVFLLGLFIGAAVIFLLKMAKGTL